MNITIPMRGKITGIIMTTGDFTVGAGRSRPQSCKRQKRGRSLSCGNKERPFSGVMIFHGSMKDIFRGLV